MSDSQSVAGVIEYIRDFAPELADKALAADDALIHDYDDLVKEATGLYLPFDYFNFLQNMGFETPIAFAKDASMDIANLYEYYRAATAESQSGPLNYILIAVGGYELEQLALECVVTDEAQNTRSGRVFYASGGNPQHVLADSFPNYLHRRAFETCASSHLSMNATYNSDQTAPVLPVIANYAAQQGWHNEWFSDSTALCLTAPDNDFVLCALQPPVKPPWLRIAGNSKSQISSLASQICQSTTLNLEQWWG